MSTQSVGPLASTLNLDSLRNTLAMKGLSSRQSEIVTLVMSGLSNREIADKLFISEKAVRSHLSDTYKKLVVKSRAQLIVYCLPHTFHTKEAS
nr:hypothetical protein BdHM001_34690 [Bdellovibrio sp. HM001]